MNIPKAALIGAGGVGKTTLIEASQERNPNVVTVSEAAREWIMDNPRAPVPFSFWAQSGIQLLAIEKERAAERAVRQQRLESPVILCDRSILDAIVYLNHMGLTDGAERLEERAEGLVHSYDALFLVDPDGVPFENDAQRTETEATRAELHKTFVDYLGKNGIGYTLLDGALEERVATLGKHLTDLAAPFSKAV